MSGYSTNLGQCICGDSLDELAKFENGTINLVVTSPPFALQRKKHTVMRNKRNMLIGYASLQVWYMKSYEKTEVLLLT